MKDLIPNSVEARDVAYHMHSYADARALEQSGPTVIERGQGIRVFDNSGKAYIEAMAGLWSVAVGFDEKRLAEAAYAQMLKLPYYHNFGLKAHGPVVDLAEKLISMAPVPMSKVFFTNSGSEANDTIVKLIWYRSNAMGKPEKKKIIARQRGYHGVTALAASLTGLPNNHKSFDLPLPGILHTMCPHYWQDGHEGETEEAFASRCADELEKMILAEGPETVAAFIGEPIMGAGGVVVPPKGYWQKIQAVLDRYDVLLIADEVITGFGRTGRMFGSETYDIRPDIMTLSKQITSSYFPFSAFMLNERVYEPIADESHRIGVLGHGFTGAAHPVGAAVALENIRIIEERDLVANAARTGAHMLSRLDEMRDHPLVGEVRGQGLIAAVELVAPKDRSAEFKTGDIGKAMAKILADNGLISRNVHDAVVLCPPLIITSAEVDEVIDILTRSLNELTAGL